MAVPDLLDEALRGGMVQEKKLQWRGGYILGQPFQRIVVVDTYTSNSGDQRELGKKWGGLPAPQSGGEFDTSYRLPCCQL